MHRIKISKISKQCFTQKGFDDRGCFGCECQDSCCKYGADFDRESFDLIVKNKEMIEPLIDKKIEDCFDKQWSGEEEYLGRSSIRSIKGGHGFCIFHKTTGKGCIIYDLVNNNKVPRRTIPSICRLFPLSWDNKSLIIYNENGNSFVPNDCNCMEAKNRTKKIY